MRRCVWMGLAVALMVNDGWGDAAWLDGYAFRRKLSVTNSAAVAADQTNFPILVRFSNANFSFQNANVDGHDVRFTAADGTTLLSYERERHDPVGVAEYWVKLPLLSSAPPTEFYVYYTPTDKADAASPTAVWDANFSLVHHMEEAAGASYVYDSTANAITGTPTAVTLGASGPIDRAVDNNSGGFVTLAPITPRPTDATFEAWFKPGVVLSANNFLFLFSGGNWGYQLQVNAATNVVSFLHTGGAIIYNTWTNVLPLGQWYYAADTYGSQGRKLYVDGVLVASSNDFSIPYNGWFETAQRISYGFNGTVDEARMSKVIRSAAWISAQNASMRNQLLACGPEEGQAAWLAGHRHRRMLTVTNATAVVSNLVNFPILVRLSSANFNFGKANADGHDVRFTAADGVTLLSYERERHNPGAALAEYWVKLPVLAAGTGTVLYVYYTSGDTPDGANPTNVWDANYIFVHHLAQSSSPYYDSTANALTGTVVGGISPGASGYIDGAVDCPGGGTYVAVAAFPRPTSATFEGWFKADVANAGMLYADIGGDIPYYIGLTAQSTLVSRVNDAAQYRFNYGSNTIQPGAWNYVADVWGGSAPPRKLYLNGVLDGTTNLTQIPYVGWWDNHWMGYAYDGVLDEMRYSKTERSAAWIKAQNASMRDQLLRYGADEGGWGSVVVLR